MEAKVNRNCVDCGADPPVTEGPITLLSLQHGWRLVRIVANSGEVTMEWRCNDCWPRYRRERERSIKP